MLLRIPSVLDAERLEAVRAALAEAPFVDGGLSAGTAARAVKHNEELDPEAAQAKDLDRVVIGALLANPNFQSAVLPHRVSRALFARYTPGMGYGEHYDDPVMGPMMGQEAGLGGRYRSDVAATVFLNAPESYEGGELVVRTSFGREELKLPAGDAVVYPASSLHGVAQVTRGERLVAAAWAQSLVRDAAKRELLYDLHVAREALHRATPQARVTATLDKVHANLVRMWAEL